MKRRAAHDEHDEGSSGRDPGRRSRGHDRRGRADRGRTAERWALAARVLVGVLHLAATVVWHSGCS